jgi:hypothetical protein
VPTASCRLCADAGGEAGGARRQRRAVGGGAAAALLKQGLGGGGRDGSVRIASGLSGFEKRGVLTVLM